MRSNVFRLPRDLVAGDLRPGRPRPRARGAARRVPLPRPRLDRRDLLPHRRRAALHDDRHPEHGGPGREAGRGRPYPDGDRGHRVRDPSVWASRPRSSPSMRGCLLPTRMRRRAPPRSSPGPRPRCPSTSWRASVRRLRSGSFVRPARSGDVPGPAGDRGDRRGLGRRGVPGPREAAARVVEHRPDRLHGARARARHRGRGHRLDPPPVQPCADEGRALPRGRQPRLPHRVRGAGEPRGGGAEHAVDDGGVPGAAASLVGVPLTAGFVSKWYLLRAALEEGLCRSRS